MRFRAHFLFFFLHLQLKELALCMVSLLTSEWLRCITLNWLKIITLQPHHWNCFDCSPWVEMFLFCFSYEGACTHTLWERTKDSVMLLNVLFCPQRRLNWTRTDHSISKPRRKLLMFWNALKPPSKYLVRRLSVKQIIANINLIDVNQDIRTERTLLETGSVK